MSDEMDVRINSMLSRDRGFAYVMLALTWLAIWFVVFQILPIINYSGVKPVVIGAALILCLFNTASILAMVRHYQEDRQHIYGMDIRHLDANRSAKLKNL